jgi:hypothetical protein
MLSIEYEGGYKQRNSSPCFLARYLLNVQNTGETKGKEQCRIGKGCLRLKKIYEVLKRLFAC